MTDLRIFSYLPNPRLYKATIAARFSGAEIEIIGDTPPNLINWLWDYDAHALADDEKESLANYARDALVGFKGVKLFKSDTFLKAHPFGNVPAGFLEGGTVGVFESNSIMRAAARTGSTAHTLLGANETELSRIDSFLDRSLVFARDLQRYLLAGDGMTVELHAEMASELTAFAAGLDSALTHSSYIVGEAVTLADICTVCDLCQLTYEKSHTARFEKLGLSPLAPTLRPHKNLGAHLKKLAADERFSADLGRYFKILLPVFD